MGQFRFVARNDPQDGSTRIKVREASEDGPELHLKFDPDRVLPPTELTDEEAARARQFVVLEEVSDEEAAEAKGRQETVARVAGGDPPRYTEAELKSKNVNELVEIAEGRNIEDVPDKKPELVAVILSSQEGASA